MSASETVNLAGSPPRPGFASELLARLRGLLPQSLNNTPLLARSAESAGELVVAHHGAVEIRRTITGWALETCVKGEPEQARETALRRLAGYAAGKNSGHGRLGTVRPLVQTAEAAGRWRVRIGVAGTDIDGALTSARNGRVRVRITEAATIAVIRASGRPGPLAIRQAETAIRDAIAGTRWEVAGSAMLRLHTLPNLLPLLGGFEVAVPVIERPVGSAEPSWSRGAAVKEAATASSLPVR
ncbi:MAG TPA: heme-binding protein [Acetobacteraceae bacterium]|nr:heme-binding protein [Acetobacteraceae bacterium]